VGDVDKPIVAHKTILFPCVNCDHCSKMKLFKIVFDNPNESFFAGQVVQGKILIYLNRPKKIKGWFNSQIGKILILNYNCVNLQFGNVVVQRSN